MDKAKSGPTSPAEQPHEKPAIRAVVFTDSDALKEAYRDALDRITEPALSWRFAESADDAVQGVDGQATVFVVDVMPSTADVRTLSSQIKQRNPACQVILVSERLAEHETWKMRHEGIDEVLLKPLAPGELIEAMSGLRSRRGLPPR